MTLLSIHFKQARRKDRRRGEDRTGVGKEMNSGLWGGMCWVWMFLSVTMSAQSVSPVISTQPKPPTQIFLWFPYWYKRLFLRGRRTWAGHLGTISLQQSSVVCLTERRWAALNQAQSLLRAPRQRCRACSQADAGWGFWNPTLLV